MESWLIFHRKQLGFESQRGWMEIGGNVNVQIWANLTWQISHVQSEPTNCLWNSAVGTGVPASAM